MGSVRRATSTRFAFRSASSLANWTPNPLDAPVTIAHLLFKFSMYRLPGFRALAPSPQNRPSALLIGTGGNLLLALLCRDEVHKMVEFAPRNPKLEFRNPKQIQNPNFQITKFHRW
jgi:hypothetical protein